MGETTEKQLKDGLTLIEKTNDDGTKEMSFTNSTINKQFVCKYEFKQGEVEALGITRFEDPKHIVSVHPGETQPFVKGKWKGLTKSIATGPCSKEWLDKQAGAAKDANQSEVEQVKELMKTKGLAEGKASSEDIAAACEAAKLPFVDVNFMPLDCSMQAPWQKGEMKMYPFKRPASWEILEEKKLKPQLFVNKIEPEDINQGSLADCYFMGAMTAVAAHERLVRDMFSGKQSPELGIYRTRICKAGLWRTVVVDDFIPCSGPKPAFSRNRDEPNELWVALLEKAYAKLNTSYFATKTGQVDQALQDLTGWPTKVMLSKDAQWDDIKAASAEGTLVVAGTPGKNLMYIEEKNQTAEDKKIWEQYRSVDLICEHSYAILKAVETKKGDRLVEVRNPWGTTQHGLWKGKWQHGGKEWTDDIKKEVGYVESDGRFWMAFEDAQKWFDKLYTAKNVSDYDTIRVPGKWVDGVPNVCLEIDVKEKTRIWVGTHQNDKRGLKAGSTPDTAYATIMAYIVQPKGDGVSCVESASTSKRERYSSLEVDPEEAKKLFVVSCPKDAQVSKEFNLTLTIENPKAVNVFINKSKKGTAHYPTVKDVKLDDWQMAEVEVQVEGKKIAKGKLEERKMKQLWDEEPLPREGQKKKKSAKVHVDPAPAPAAKAKVRSGSGPAVEKKPLSEAPAKAQLRSKTSAAPAKSGAASESPPAAKPLKSAVKLSGATTVEVFLKKAEGLANKGSMNPFCELKLRTVANGVVGSDHPNPQKQTSKVVNKNLSPAWGEKFTFNVPESDCIRISIFGKKMMGKDYLGRVDLKMAELADFLEKGAPPVEKTYKVSGEDEGRGAVSGTLDLELRLF